MFRIQTTDPGQLRRIIIGGAGALILGLVLLVLNLVVPLLGSGYATGNFVFGAFGVLVVVLATHPTYQAALKLDD